MSTEKDSMLRVRLTQRQSDELDAIIDELQAQMPEASVTTSSIARYALEKYVSDHIAKRDGTKIFIEISHRRCHRRGHKESLRPSFQVV